MEQLLDDNQFSKSTRPSKENSRLRVKRNYHAKSALLLQSSKLHKLSRQLFQLKVTKSTNRTTAQFFSTSCYRRLKISKRRHQFSPIRVAILFLLCGLVYLYWCHRTLFSDDVPAELYLRDYRASNSRPDSHFAPNVNPEQIDHVNEQISDSNLDRTDDDRRADPEARQPGIEQEPERDPERDSERDPEQDPGRDVENELEKGPEKGPEKDLERQHLPSWGANDDRSFRKLDFNAYEGTENHIEFNKEIKESKIQKNDHRTSSVSFSSSTANSVRSQNFRAASSSVLRASQTSASQTPVKLGDHQGSSSSKPSGARPNSVISSELSNSAKFNNAKSSSKSNNENPSNSKSAGFPSSPPYQSLPAHLSSPIIHLAQNYSFLGKANYPVSKSNRSSSLSSTFTLERSTEAKQQLPWYELVGITIFNLFGSSGHHQGYSNNKKFKNQTNPASIGEIETVLSRPISSISSSTFRRPSNEPDKERHQGEPEQRHSERHPEQSHSGQSYSEKGHQEQRHSEPDQQRQSYSEKRHSEQHSEQHPERHSEKNHSDERPDHRKEQHAGNNRTLGLMKNLKQSLPQCIIIGVRKAGTRAVLEYLTLNDRIRKADNEVHFFDNDERYALGLDYYRTQMPFTTPGQIGIEKSPAYYVTATVPERIRTMNASIKLILIVRDPVTRLISDYTQLTHNKLLKLDDLMRISGSKQQKLENHLSEFLLSSASSAEFPADKKTANAVPWPRPRATNERGEPSSVARKKIEKRPDDENGIIEKSHLTTDYYWNREWNRIGSEADYRKAEQLDALEDADSLPVAKRQKRRTKATAGDLRAAMNKLLAESRPIDFKWNRNSKIIDSNASKSNASQSNGNRRTAYRPAKTKRKIDRQADRTDKIRNSKANRISRQAVESNAEHRQTSGQPEHQQSERRQSEHHEEQGQTDRRQTDYRQTDHQQTNHRQADQQIDDEDEVYRAYNELSPDDEDVELEDRFDDDYLSAERAKIKKAPTNRDGGQAATSGATSSRAAYNGRESSRPSGRSIEPPAKSNKDDHYHRRIPKFEELVIRNGEVNTNYRPVKTSIYSLYMDNWLRVFRRDQIHIVDGDRLIREPHVELNKIETFLGLVPNQIRQNHFVFNRKKNFFCARMYDQPHGKLRSTDKLRSTNGDFASTNSSSRLDSKSLDSRPLDSRLLDNRLNNRLSNQLGNRLDSANRKPNKTAGRHSSVRCLNSSKGRPHPQVDSEVISKLRQFYAPFNRHFERLVGIKFNWPEI